VKAVIVLRNLRLARTSVSCQVGRCFAAESFCVKHETFFVEGMIRSVKSVSEHHYTCLVSVILGGLSLN